MVGWDHLASAWVVAHRYPPLDAIMWLLSGLGRGGMVWLAIGALVAWRRSRWPDFATLVVAALLTTVVADYILKPTVNRKRPFVLDATVRVIGGRPHDASFPSGHAANSFAGALVLSSTAPAGRAAWWLLAIAIAYSRVYLGVHYPLDVMAGALIGLCCAGLVVYIRRSAIVCGRVAGNLRNVRP
jgi:undecaprenyl-diphosphatase